MDMKNIQIIFFLPSPYESQDDSSEEMQQAFEACKQNSIEVKWVLEYEFKSLELKKTDIIVFPSFEGACFEKVQSSKSVRIVGPWCLLTCLTQGVKIPNFPWPIYSIAMNNCTITGSALPKAQRLEIQEKIQHMGGFYILNLVKKCTHLVTDSVKSEKYIKAAETGVKILLPSWVYDVWESSSKGNIHCNDAPFIDKHRCPTFHKLVVCCTGLSMPQRTELHRLIEENGGTYKEQLHLSSTDILVCNSGTASNKYLAAKKRNIKCVSFDWVKDSIKNGYAMPDNHYSVKISTSTPTKDDMAPPNFSMISNITTLSKCTNPNDTIEGTFNISMPPPQSVIKKRKMDSNEHNELVDSINMQNVKMAGPFLDGCGIYLVGFGMEQREKLCKILNFGGATRYDDISERVTHIIVGNTSCHDLKLLTFKDTFKNYPIVSIQWLLDSLIAECPVSEEKYIISAINLTKPDSPLSKKGLHVLRENNSSQERSIHISTAVSEIEVDVAKQYLGNAASVEEDTLARLLHDASDFQSKKDTPCIEIIEPPKSLERKQSLSNKDDSFSSAVDDSSQPSEPIFEDLKFVITGFPADSHEQVKLTIEAMSGKIASKLYKGVLDYAVVPIISTELLKQPATYIVTDLWISECWQENEIRPVSYFHKPISIKEGAHPLKGCVITLSSYVNYERIFLRNLIMELGGICQDQLSKITCSKTGVIACTHLVTPEPTGKKYVAAVKWGMPVINKDWLLECARTSQLASESLYLVGDSKCSKTTAITSSTMLGTPSNLYIDSSKPKSSVKIAEMPKPSNVLNTLDPLMKLNCPSSARSNTSPPTTEKSNSIELDGTSLRSLPNNNTSNPITLVVDKIVTETHKKKSLETHNKNPFGVMQSEKTSSEVSDPITPVSSILAEARKKNWLKITTQANVRVSQSHQEISSQVTPVHKVLAEANKCNLPGTPEDRLSYPKAWDHVDTPDTPLGAFIRPNPSPNLRKQMLRYLNTFPDTKPRRNSTPLTEVKRKLWDKICPPKDNLQQPDFDTESEEMEESFEKVSTPSKSIPENIVNDQLQQLHDMLTASGGGDRDSTKRTRQSIIPVVASEVKDSQPSTIGWDDFMECDVPAQPQKPIPIFMFTGLEQEARQLMTSKLEKIGAVVVELVNFDPKCTHLICPKPSRNEKILASMAAGKWILHPSYIDKCAEAGKLVDEETFEFGNPKSCDNVHLQADKENEGRFSAIHYWRKEIARRGYGPFYDMKAIVVSKRRDPLVRILQAGGALVVDAQPPYDEHIHATHCIIDLKSTNDISIYVPLATRGIYCVNVIFVDDYLQRRVLDPRDAIIPDLIKYYRI